MNSFSFFYQIPLVCEILNYTSFSYQRGAYLEDYLTIRPYSPKGKSYFLHSIALTSVFGSNRYAFSI